MRRRVALVAALAAALLGLVRSADRVGRPRRPDRAGEAATRPFSVSRRIASCGPGEAYLPMDIDTLLGNATVALRGPWGGGDLVKIAPSGEDLAGGLYDYHLDFPGDALNPGCGYVHWASRVTAGKPAVAYAHVATQSDAPGRLALQYWFFYAFNDWNNLHEGDWEMVQVNFDASSAQDALDASRSSIGYSQHEGAERAAGATASSSSRTARIRCCIRPTARMPASTARRCSSAPPAPRASAATTRGRRSRRSAPRSQTIPSDPDAAREAFPWIAFQGRWGELQPAFYNGPTGPNLKTQWTQPVLWESGWRDRSVAVPAGGALGTRTTEFFCGAIAHGSNLLTRALDNPSAVLLALAVLIGLVAIAAGRTTWRPSAPLRLARRRATGQIISASGRMYFGHLALFIGIGSILLPITLLDALLQAFLLHASGVAGIEAQGEGEGVLALLVVALGTALTLLGVAFVMAATVRALAELDAGRRVSPLRAYRGALDSVRPLLAGLVVAAVIVTILVGTIVLLPIAIALVIRWALIVPVTELENPSGLGALRRSGRLVGRRWLKVACLTVLSLGLVLLTGPLLGTLLVLVTSLSLTVVNAVAGVVYAVLMPYVAITTAYVYFDVRVRQELADSDEQDHAVLDAELETSFS